MEDCNRQNQKVGRKGKLCLSKNWSMTSEAASHFPWVEAVSASKGDSGVFKSWNNNLSGKKQALTVEVTSTLPVASNDYIAAMSRLHAEATGGKCTWEHRAQPGKHQNSPIQTRAPGQSSEFIWLSTNHQWIWARCKTLTFLTPNSLDIRQYRFNVFDLRCVSFFPPQVFQSLSTSCDSPDFSPGAAPLRGFKDVTASVSELRDKLETVLNDTWPKISTTSNTQILTLGFWLYSCPVLMKTVSFSQSRMLTSRYCRNLKAEKTFYAVRNSLDSFTSI